MEAAVQRDPTNARAWYELGVKQQENEREQQAIWALQRALDLDPAHLPSWLALAISYTNEGDRHGTYEAIQNWVRNNKTYRDVIAAYETGDGAESSEGQALIGCLIAMARGIPQSGMSSTEVDADVQIALAVLLNTNGVWQTYLAAATELQLLIRPFRTTAELKTVSVLRCLFDLA
jgi:peroxin-5